MPGYSTRELRMQLGEREFLIRALSDRQQYDDGDGEAERIGISSAQWSLFGQVWPAGQALAAAMVTFDIGGRRILEIGCGLGLASLVLQGRDADVTASDHHPLAATFLAHNAAANGLADVAYRHLAWALPDPGLGRFDVVIGSDILYERHSMAVLVAMLERHCRPRCQVLIADPGRGNANRFSRAMAAHGYGLAESHWTQSEAAGAVRGRMLSYTR